MQQCFVRCYTVLDTRATLPFLPTSVSYLDCKILLSSLWLALARKEASSVLLLNPSLCVCVIGVGLTVQPDLSLTTSTSRPESPC